MNKKIILLVAVLLIVAIVFAACKGKTDVEEPTESTTESKVESTNEPTSGELIIGDISDEDFNTLIPGTFEDGDMSGEGVIHVGGDSNESSGEDSISWSEVVGN